MKVWIDKQGGRHYHKEDCSMVTDLMFHYEPVEAEIDKKMFGEFAPVARYDGIIYMPCPGCISK